MSRKFKTPDYESKLNQTIRLSDALPPNHLARFVVDIITQLDLTAIYRRYAPVGGEALAPEILLGLLFYSYATGLFSSRQLERATSESIPFRYVAGGWHPDHETIAHFRKTFLAEIQDLFVQILLLAQAAHVLKLGTISLEGSKIHADASQSHAVSYKHLLDLEVRLRQEVSELLTLGERVIGDFIKKLDQSRPVTSAVNDLKPDKDPYFATLDVAGYNYASGGDHNQQSLYVKDHSRIPERIMYGSESYPLEAFGSWMDVIDNSFVIGDFVWTAFDYIGEASIGWRGYWQKQDFFPWNLAFCGDIDICGWKRPQSFYRDALWKENQLSVWVTSPEPSFGLNAERQSWSKWHWYGVADDWNWKGRHVRTRAWCCM